MTALSEAMDAAARFAKNASLSSWHATNVECHQEACTVILVGYFAFTEEVGDDDNNASKRLCYEDPFEIKLRIVEGNVVDVDWVGVQESP
ncbi:MAG: hypothetical protein C0478_05260 [Planctomyces sp.]|nr:hypothetical protein [Planctomyces sp.]